MADITRRLFLRHLQAAPTSYVRHIRSRRGAVAHEGAGISFWYRPLRATISEVPVDERELPLLFHARSRDYQDVAVQATVTYRIADPGLVADRIDFSIDPGEGRWRASPLDQLAALITELAQQYALAVLARSELTELLVDGLPRLREAIAAGLSADTRLQETGLEVVGVRVVAIRPEPELEQALQTPVREVLQQDADRATYERRATAVEQERAIGENELQNQIELARREEQLVDQQGLNERRRVAEQMEAARIRSVATAEQVEASARAKATATRLVGAAEAESEADHVAAYRGISDATLLGLAVRELAGNLPPIDTLVVTPDLLAPALARLAASSTDGVAASTDADRASAS